MSELWTHDKLDGVARVSAFAPPAIAAFTPWPTLPRAGPAASDEAIHFAVPVEDSVIDPSAIHAEGFAQGHAEGLRTLERAILDERAAVADLATTLATLRPEPAAPLAALLAQTVRRLVAQVVGEVAIDETLLLARATGAAELIADATAPAVLRVHPQDHERLAGAALTVDLVADPAVPRGAVVVEGPEGWIEDGPAAALERLDGLLDRMGIA